MADYDGAHYMVKDWMEPAVLKLLKQVNSMNADAALIIAGGDVLSTIFTGPNIFRTHDFDIKAALKSDVVIDENNIEKLYSFADNFTKLAAVTVNERYAKTRKQLDALLAEKFGVKITIHKGNKDYFGYHRPVPDWALFTISYRLEDLNGDSWNLDPLMDVFAATPDTINSAIKGRYQMFIGGEPKLSTEKQEYYIPTRDVDGVLYAGIGFMLWDTGIMIEISEQMANEGKKNKLQRYKDKRLAILDDLNHPEKRLHCRFMEQYVKYCDKDLDSCKIPAWNVKDQKEAQDKLEHMGLMDDNIVKSLGKVYVCDYAKKMSNYF